MDTTRNTETATSFFRLSVKGSSSGNGDTALPTVQEVPADDAMALAQSLEEYTPPPGAVDTANLHMSAARRIFDRDLVTADGADEEDQANVAPMSVAKSWRVSPDEFVVKIDASPLHMSVS